MLLSTWKQEKLELRICRSVHLLTNRFPLPPGKLRLALVLVTLFQLSNLKTAKTIVKGSLSGPPTKNANKVLTLLLQTILAMKNMALNKGY